MSLDGQPNTILDVYSPFAWIEDTTGTFVTYPTTQDALINFPGTIGCSEIIGYNSTTINIPSTLSIGTGFGFLTDEIEANTGAELNIVTLNDKAVNIGTSTTRTSNINIGSNPSNVVGETTGNVNIMCGTGRQEGSFNVLTNANNDGIINLGNTTTGTGGINIYGELLRGLQLGYSPTTYSGLDTYVGGYKEGTYQNLVAMTLNTTQQRIVGSISTAVSVGLYQLNVISTMTANKVRPQLTFGIYTKTSPPAWVNGALRSGSGTLVSSLNTTNHYYTTGVANKFSSSLSGLLAITTRSYVAVVVGNADEDTMNISTVDSTYISILRVG